MKRTIAAKSKKQPLRFAHPFFTTTPISKRKPAPGIPGAGTSLTDYVQGHLYPIPAPRRTPNMTLADVIGAQGAQQIAGAQSILFHSVGDTGKGVDTPQGDVANAMTTDFNISHPAACPAFFFHLGDVIYGPNKEQEYRPEFYEPYVHYPGKIIAIPGNHDGEVFPKTDPKSLAAFQENFCAPSQTVPPIAGTIYRETMNQPGVYWFLDCPFVQIVGLYSNAAENPGFISGRIPGQAQKKWLIQTLKTIATQRKTTRKALVLATHHPPFTAGGFSPTTQTLAGHSPSTQMLADIDDACNQGGVMPDLYLSGHAHSYQRYTRNVPFSGRALQIPYIVAGTGGINDQTVMPASGQTIGDHTFVKSLQGYGYLLVEVSATTLTSTMFQVNTTTKAKTQYDVMKLDLTTSKVLQ